MLLLFYFLLVVGSGRCADDQHLETKTVRVRENVNISCPRKEEGSFFWIRLVSGAFPRVIQKTARYKLNHDRIQVSTESGRFNLIISKAELNDTAVYLCLKTAQNKLVFLNGVDLRVEAREPDVTAVALPGPIGLGCSEAPNSDNNTEENSVYCFKAQPPLRFKCNEGNTFGECDTNHDGQLAKKCVFSFFKNISSSDAGSHYCAVATCEETESGNGSEADNAVVFVLSAALAVSLLVVASLLYSVKKLQNKSCDCCKASVVQRTASGYQENQTDEDSLVYSRVIFTHRKSSKAERRGREAQQ